MTKSNNINWAAFLLGGTWGGYNSERPWSVPWIVLYGLTLATLFFENFFMAISVYILMSVFAVYLALIGNSIIVEKIRKQNLSEEAEERKRLAEEAK
jgi:predicted membrane protein